MNKSPQFRCWFYFRTGYSQYFMFILAIFNMLTLTYYLAIENYEGLKFVFPTFASYVIITTVVIIPLLIFLGFAHMRRTGAYRSEVEVTFESNPYNYKLPPGIQKEVMGPLLLELLVLLKDSQASIPAKELEKIKELDQKLEFLAKGGMLNIPKKFDNL